VYVPSSSGSEVEWGEPPRTRRPERYPSGSCEVYANLSNQGGGFFFGLFVHSLHTVIVARDGKRIANLEGNQLAAQQFADLLQRVLNPARN
jgi:hypothetical protein